MEKNKWLPFLLLPFLCSCASTGTQRAEPVQAVRLTVYWAKGKGADQWSRRGQSASGVRLVEGKHVAADPSLFPYGTRLYIEGVGERTVVDTGRAVVARTAAKRLKSDAPVIDLFFERKRDALAFAGDSSLFVVLRRL